MNAGTKRSILRWLHLFSSIPILSYIYGPGAEVQQYAGAVRFIFVPVIILSGLWMYLGMVFAVIGAAAWVGAYRLAGFWGAVLSQILLLIACKIWLRMRGRRLRVQGERA